MLRCRGFIARPDRSDLIVDRDYDEAITMDLKPIYIFPFLSPPPLCRTIAAPPPLSLDTDAVVCCRRQNLFQPSRCEDSVRETLVGFIVQTNEGTDILVVDRT
ncbi:hypothetical protein F511_25541 [Dorcoceras hygrometricum]|uniref:Uncharacterized protein n=1 Tax=Dorcoceras hygrometricum TaxID=472368 RepID=A0A2Z7A361_9LAMI|nr:hypothetical protein F511_25541 [Dorcoceras hygrometricum]